MSKELYVGSLPLQYTEEDLRRLFAVAGSVSYIHLVTDPQTGESKGCAYVKMSSEREAKDAIECLDGARVENHHIKVSVARPQKPKAPGASPRPRRPAERVPAKSVERSADRTVEQSSDRTAERSSGRTAERTSGKPAAKSPGRAAERAGGKPRGGSGGGPKGRK
jgi:RNA recognition motif-containing protein